MKRKQKLYQELSDEKNGLGKPMRYTLRVILQLCRSVFTLSFLLSAVFFVGVWLMQWASVILMKSTLAGAESVDWMSFVGAWAPPMLFVIIVGGWLTCVITKFIWKKLGVLCDIICVKLKLKDANESE